MHARYYDPTTGQFISPDSIVPEPGRIVAYNRYLYAYADPLTYSDPSGHQSVCVGGDSACWEARWYAAHGYRRVGGMWVGGFDAEFWEAAARDEVLADAGIVVQGAANWASGELDLMAQGVVALQQRMAGAANAAPDGGDELLRAALGGRVWLQRLADSLFASCQGMAACTFFGSTVQMYDFGFASGDDFARGAFVHELGHVVDASSGGSLSRGLPDQARALTWYAATGVSEYFAEAVSDWVYGNRYRPPDARGLNEGLARQHLSEAQVDYLNANLAGAQ